MVQPILQLGDPRLEASSSPIGIEDVLHLKAWQADMQDTLASIIPPNPNWTVSGLTAAQIGLMKRMCLLWFRDKRRWFLLNPRVIDQGGDTRFYYEACYSIPGRRIRVPRPSWAVVRYEDENLVPHEERFEGMIARLALHEIDHTNGVLAIHRMNPADRVLTEEEWARMISQPQVPLTADPPPPNPQDSE